MSRIERGRCGVCNIKTIVLASCGIRDYLCEVVSLSYLIVHRIDIS